MPTRLISALILSLALITSACSSPMKTPDIKQNPHPTKRYDITMTIEDAPGSFDSVAGFASYEVDKDDPCAPKDSVSGLHNIPEQNPAIRFTRVSDQVYKGEIYLDLMQDADYYGLGVCRWSMTTVVTQLKIHDLLFGSSIRTRDIISGNSEKTYFAKRLYFDTTARDFGYGGTPMSDDVVQHPSEYFSVTLTGKESQP